MIHLEKCFKNYKKTLKIAAGLIHVLLFQSFAKFYSRFFINRLCSNKKCQRKPVSFVEHLFHNDRIIPIGRK